MRYSVYVAAALAAIASASPAFAQVNTANAVARGLVLEPLTLSKVEDLDFGTVAGDPTLAGTVVIDVTDPTNPARSKTGGVTLVPSSWKPAQFAGYGDPGSSVILTLSPPTVLINQSNAAFTVDVNSMVLDTCGCLSDTRTLDGSGAITLYVGGDFAIKANQQNGVYSNTFSVTADYQ